MKTIALQTQDGRSVAHRVYLASSWAERACGLLNRRTLEEGEGLLLAPGRSIHTLGLPFSIDVVFLTRQMRVLRLAHRVKPWSMRIAPFGTRNVLELPAGRIAALGLRADTYLLVQDDTLAAPSAPSSQERHTPCSELRFSMRVPTAALRDDACRAARGTTEAPAPLGSRSGP